MTAPSLRAVADRLAELCRADQSALDELYAEGAVSVEAAPGPEGGDPASAGLDAIRAKHDWWEASFEVHAAEVDGPFLHGEDRFALIFRFEATHKPSGERSRMAEVGVYHVANGKITREEFFYTM